MSSVVTSCSPEAAHQLSVAPPQNHFANFNRLRLMSITDVHYRNAGAMEGNGEELVLLLN